jgi:hypothetical protein
METLLKVLSKMFDTNITHASYSSKRLRGGTVGNVRLIKGVAESSIDEKFLYKFVLKIQHKWAREDDPDSWRREYDLYSENLHSSGSLRWPECYHSEISENQTQLWIEYIEGVSGVDLTVDMYEAAARSLGRFQGRLFAHQPAMLQKLKNVTETEFTEKFYLHNKSFNVVFDYIRSYDCAIPSHLCKMIIDADNYAYKVFHLIKTLPVVLCHRDFWHANIFYCDGEIILIDWDTTGWGYFGEDIASLIADESDVEHMADYFQRCVPAYCEGFSEYADISRFNNLYIRERIIITFGYRLIKWFLQTEKPKEKKLYLDTLQKIYEFESNFH